MSEIKVDIQGLLPLKRQLQLLKMPKNTRRRLMFRVAKKVISDSRKRVRNQVDLNGRPFEQRKRKRNSQKRKMLSRMIKGKNLKVTRNDSVQANIGLPGSGAIAADHQYGKVSRVSASQFSEGNKPEFYERHATKKQAKALIEAGFKIKKKSGKGTKSPTQKFITENYTIGQAGYALRHLRIWAGQKSANSWVTKLPARSFLGATPTEISAHIDQIFKDMKREMNYVAR